MATRRIREFLDGNSAPYVTIGHSASYTASQAAQSTHIPGRYMAKTVIINVDGTLAMAVVPATQDVNLDALRRHVFAGDVRLAAESEFARRFEGCQLGTVPPFGDLFGIKTYIDGEMARRDQIAFMAGTHTDVIVMPMGEYLRLAKPQQLKLAIKPLGAECEVVSI